MTKDITKKDPTVLDNFDGWDDGVEGDDRPQSAGIIQGTLIKFTNEATWVTRNGDELPADLELVAVDVARVVQKWGSDGMPINDKTIILEPHQKFPNIKKMNEETPKEQWVEGPDGKPCGPWQAQHIVYLLDPKTMDKYTFPTGTKGGAIGVGELVKKINWMRKFRGPNVYAAITLFHTFFPTRYGGRQRPHFVIKPPWVRLGGEGGQVEALPSMTSSEQLDAVAEPAAPQTTPQSDLPLTAVKEPSLAEEMNDEIPDFGNEKDSAEAAPPAQNNKAKAPQPRPTARRDLKKQSPKTGASAANKKRLSNLDAG